MFLKATLNSQGNCRQFFKGCILGGLVFFSSACESPVPAASNLSGFSSPMVPDSSVVDPANPSETGKPGESTIVESGAPESDHPEPSLRSYRTAVLIFNGVGVSTSDWQSTESIVQEMGLSYRLVNSSQMNTMTQEELNQYGVIVVPGGLGSTITSNLNVAARLRIRRAVRDAGVGYVGFCAGAWVAVGPEANSDSVAAYGFAVAQGSVLDAWYPAGNVSAVADVVEVSFADGASRGLVWWGGPATPEWSGTQGSVIARYTDGAPALSQREAGKGWVVIAGPHPEAPWSWRGTAGSDWDGLDFMIAERMILSALEHQAM